MSDRSFLTYGMAASPFAAYEACVHRVKDATQINLPVLTSIF